MEPAYNANRLEKFSNLPGTITFKLWKQLFIANINAKSLEISLQPQEANELTAAKLLTANKADAQLLFELLNSIDKEPRTWALLNFPITEKPVQWSGFMLWQGIKKHYDDKPIPQEIYLAKMKCLNSKCHGNVKGYIQEVQDNRKKYFEIADLDKNKSMIFDHDMIQSVLLNLPPSFLAFTIIFRTNPSNDFDMFAEQIQLEDRQMKPTL